MAAVRGLSFWYPDAGRPALRDVDLDVRAGELLVLCGPSGGGKSTLLRLLQGIVPQRSGGDLVGEATALDHDVTRTPPHRLAAAGITLLYQNPLEGFVAERVGDEVAFGPENLGLAGAEIVARVREALADVGLDEIAGRPLAGLSGGEQQRVALAAALALRPRLLLLDEPTAHLDEPGAVALLGLLDRIRRSRGTTVVMAEHRVAVAASIADRIALIVDGTVRAAGAPRAILADPRLAALGVPVPRVTQAALRLGLTDDLPLTPGELAERLRTRRIAPAEGGDPARRRTGAAAEPHGDVVVSLDRIRFRYPDAAVDALSDVSFALRRGERVALVGPSGAGKSTLARVAVGLRRATAGHVAIFGMTDPPLGSIASRMGLVVQNPLRQLLGETVEREIALGLRGRGDAETRRRIEEALDRFGLAALRDRHPLSLSEGERRRVTLAAVAARRPELLVLDEPTLGQDETQRAALSALMRELAAAGTAVLAITHDREFVNDACARVLVMRAGRIDADLTLGGDAATIGALVQAGVPLADVPGTVRALAREGVDVSARTIDDLAEALG